MAKIITCEIIITSLRAKVDKSLGVSFVTPELSSKEKAEFMELQNLRVSALLTPIEGPTNKELKINKDIETKSQSERIRSVLYILWKQSKVETTFDDFYKSETEKIIDEIKSKLEG